MLLRKTIIRIPFRTIDQGHFEKLTKFTQEYLKIKTDRQIDRQRTVIFYINTKLKWKKNAFCTHNFTIGYTQCVFFFGKFKIDSPQIDQRISCTCIYRAE